MFTVKVHERIREIDEDESGLKIKCRQIVSQATRGVYMKDSQHRLLLSLVTY